MQMMSRTLFLLGLAGMCFFIASCDGPPFTGIFATKNFAWADHSTVSYGAHASAHRTRQRELSYIVLRVHGQGEFAGNDWFVLLIVRENPVEKLQSLEAGIVIWTWLFDRPDSAKIIRLRVLDGKQFDTEPVYGEIDEVTYNGRVYGKSTYDKGGFLEWLKFDVKSRADEQVVSQVMRRLYPLLKDEAYAKDVAPYIRHFVADTE